MSTSYFPKAPLTDHLIVVAKEIGFPVGDASYPDEDHGWQGEPNEGATNFIPWYVIVPGQAGTSSGPMESSQADWRMPYYVTISGVTRAQTEMMSDLLRKSLISQQRVRVDCYGDKWAIQQVRVVSVGGISRQSAINPSYFLQTDTVEIWYSKDLT